MATVKKKIELYVSETGGTKVAKYYRIPIESDSLPYHPETNRLKDRVRFYAKLSADKLYYAYFTNYDEYIDNFATTASIKQSNELASPTIPIELLNDGESKVYIRGFDSDDGIQSFSDTDIQAGLYVVPYGSNITKTPVTKSSIFLPGNMIESDRYSDLINFIPSNWVEIETIDEIVSEVNEFRNNKVAHRPAIGNDFFSQYRLSEKLGDPGSNNTNLPGYVDITNRFTNTGEEISLSDVDADIVAINLKQIQTGKQYQLDFSNVTGNVHLSYNNDRYNPETILGEDKHVIVRHMSYDGIDYATINFRTIRFDNPNGIKAVIVRPLDIPASVEFNSIIKDIRGYENISYYRDIETSSDYKGPTVFEFVSNHEDELVYHIDSSDTTVIKFNDLKDKMHRNLLFVKLSDSMIAKNDFKYSIEYNGTYGYFTLISYDKATKAFQVCNQHNTDAFAEGDEIIVEFINTTLLSGKLLCITIKEGEDPFDIKVEKLTSSESQPESAAVTPSINEPESMAESQPE